MFKNLWNDQSGALISAELVLIMTLLICAIVVGISAVRTATVTELADVAASIGVINQSYSVGGISSHHAYCSGWFFLDQVDSCDYSVAQPLVGNSRCVMVCLTSTIGEAGNWNYAVPAAQFQGTPYNH